jgi:hypothetical protein
MAAAFLSLALCGRDPVVAQVGDMRQVLELHLARYPDMQVGDLYKLLHQAAMGSEHAISSREAARQWLIREVEALGDPPAQLADEPLIEPISPGGRLVRVNLRPYLREGGDMEVLLDAFVQTAEHYSGDAATLDDYCRNAIDLAREGALPFSSSDLQARFAELKRQGYPAVHHSATYREAYGPSYRVVARKLLSVD